MSPKPSSLFEKPDSRILRGYCGAIVGLRNLTTSAHFILGPRLVPRREKRLRTDKESPNGLEALPRTILLSAPQIPRGENSAPIKAASQSAPKRRVSTVKYL